MTGLKAYLSSTASAAKTAHRLLFSWLFGDLIYAVLPIITIAVITLFRDDGFSDFASIKEWSFAAIVLYGVAIRKLIRIKVAVQRDPSSYKLDTGVQLLVVMLVVSVLVLAFVILNEKGAGLALNKRSLGVAQILLFLLGALTLLSAVVAEEDFSATADLLPRTDSREVLGLHLVLRLNSAIQTLDYLAFAVQRLDSFPLDESADGYGARRYASLQRSLEDSLARAESLIAEIKHASETRSKPGTNDGAPG